MVKELEAIRTGAGFSTVRIMPFGLSDTNGTAPISDDANGHLSRIVNAGMPNSTLATVRRLDDLDIPLPDLIKIDVEDHERAVLEGASSLIKASRPVILFECWEPKSPDNMAIIEMLAKLDYVLHYIGVSADGVSLSAIDTSQPAFPAAPCNIFACPKDRLTAWLS
jgi:FkbM family methyltransferase